MQPKNGLGGSSRELDDFSLYYDSLRFQDSGTVIENLGNIREHRVRGGRLRYKRFFGDVPECSHNFRSQFLNSETLSYLNTIKKHRAPLSSRPTYF